MSRLCKLGLELLRTLPPQRIRIANLPRLSLRLYTSNTSSAPIPGQTMTSNCNIESTRATEPSCAKLYRNLRLLLPAVTSRMLCASSANQTPYEPTAALSESGEPLYRQEYSHWPIR